MKNYLFITLIMAILALSGYSLAAESKSENVQRITRPQITKHENENLDNIYEQIKEIRRDQLNYKIEKDLIKEIYASHLQIINIVIAIIASVFAFLGFFGLRDISTLQKTYRAELENLQNLKSEFQLEIKNINDEQKKAKDQYVEIATINETQNNKIKILELLDKMDKAYDDRQYTRALEYCTLVIELEGNNISAWQTKGYCHFKLMQYSDAIKAFLRLASIDTDNVAAIANLCELYLITEDFGKYEENVTKLGPDIKTTFGGGLDVYFIACKCILRESTLELKTAIINYLRNCASGKRKGSLWDFSDFQAKLSEMHIDENNKKIMDLFISYLKGEIEKEAIIPLLD